MSYLYNVPGAKLGNHKVTIETFYEDEDSEEAKKAVEKIPKRYNLHSTLTAEVKPGKNTIDFDLQSK